METRYFREECGVREGVQIMFLASFVPYFENERIETRDQVK